MGLCIWIGILDRSQLYLPYVHPCALCPVDTLSCPLPDNYWPQSILSAFTSMRKKNSFLCSFFSRVVCTVNVNSLGCHAHCAHFAHTMRSGSLKTFRPAYWTGQEREREIEEEEGRDKSSQRSARAFYAVHPASILLSSSSIVQLISFMPSGPVSGWGA